MHPFFGIAKQELRFVPDPTEVARIIEPPYSFLDESIVIETRLTTSYAHEMNVPASRSKKKNTIVWVDAMML
jgi:hypothetical protein